MKRTGRKVRAGVSAGCLGSPLLFCIFASAAFALDPEKRVTQFSHRSWGGAGGLDQVFSIAQTADGYIWVGAVNGLFRFDGFRFEPREPARGEPKLPAYPNQMLGATDGSLWIASGDRLLRLEHGLLADSPLPGAQPGGEIRKLQEGPDGTIWVATGFGLFRSARSQWDKVELPAAFKNPAVLALLIDRGGTAWAGVIDRDNSGKSGVLYLRPGEAHFRTVFEAIGAVVDMAETRDGQIWMSPVLAWPLILQDDGRSPYLLDRDVRFSRSPAQLHFDRDGNLWAASHGPGVIRFDAMTVGSTNSLGPVESKESAADTFTRQDGLSSQYANCIFEDREGNIWVGTAGGLDCFADARITALSNREGLPYDANLSIQATSDGEVWAMSTPGGFERIDADGRHFKALGWTNWVGGGLAFSYCLFADNGTDIIAGAMYGLGLIHEGVLSAFPLPESLELKTVTAITREADGGLWLCDRDKGVFQLSGSKLQRFAELTRSPAEHVITAYTDGLGRVWLGYAKGGIACVEKGQVLRFASSEGLFPGQVRTIFSDDNGNVWAAGNGGLSRFENGRFQTLTRENGLRDDDIYAVLEDGDQFFWVAGVHGLFRTSRSKLEQAMAQSIQAVEGELFDVNDGMRGIVHHEVAGNQGICYTVATKSRDGKLWFSTSTGLAIVDPGHIPRNPLPPAVHIQAVKAAGKSYQGFQSLRFPKGTKDCEIDYAGLSFSDPAGVQYKYRLEGYDKEWINAGTRRQAFYSNLRPRAYRFRVRACNRDGVWNEAGAQVGFSIIPAFYETIWFPVLCAVTFGAGLFGLHRLRVAQSTARIKLQLASQQQERKRIARELHDTLLQGFTGIGLRLDALASTLPDVLTKTKEQMQKILEQSDKYLSDARRSVWELRSTSLVESDDFSITLANAGKRLLDGTGVQLDFLKRGDIRQLFPVVEDNLLRICEEAVANAVKHARPTRIEVRLEFNARKVELFLRDNGCGFDVKSAASSRDGHFGLIGMKERVKSMGGQFTLNGQPGQGTEILVTVPAGRAFPKISRRGEASVPPSDRSEEYRPRSEH